MSKSRNRKWYDYDEGDESVSRKDRRFQDRRKDKKIKAALKTQNLDYIEVNDE